MTKHCIESTFGAKISINSSEMENFEMGICCLFCKIRSYYVQHVWHLVIQDISVNN